MAKSIIVYGRDLNRMMKYAERIAKHLGMSKHLDWGARSSFKIPAQDTVIFFKWALSEAPQIRNGHKAISFAEVAQQINDAIPLTDWQIGSPPMAGEWNASRFEQEENRMWWNGEFWSASFYHDTPEKQKNILSARKNAAGHWAHGVKWRGLSEEPILVTA